MRGFELIVSRCNSEGATGPYNMVRVLVPSFPEAHAKAQEHKKFGRSVVIRPNFNEGSGLTRYFREWRSFNGKPWEECRWNIPAPIGDDTENIQDYCYNV